jgi:hypothetical protein
VDNDLDLGRYAAGLRRHARAIASIALLTLIAGSVVALRSRVTESVQFRAFPKVVELDSVGLDTEQFDVDKVMDIIAALANEDRFESEIGEAVGADVKVSARRDLEKPLVMIKIGAASEDLVVAADQAVTERLSTTYIEEFQADLIRVRTGAERRQTLLEEQLADVDAQLAAAGPNQQTLVEGLLVERQRLTEQITGQDVILTAVERFDTSLPGDLRRSTLDEPDRRSPLLLGGLGLIAGTVVSVLGVLLLVALDRSVRTRRDLNRVGLHDLLGVVPQPSTPTAIVATRRAITHAAAVHKATVAQIVPLSAATEVSWMDTIDGAVHGTCQFELRKPTTESPEAFEFADDTTITVLAVAWGCDRREKVVRAANEFAAAGSPHIAIVLCGVPPKETSGVEG